MRNSLNLNLTNRSPSSDGKGKDGEHSKEVRKGAQTNQSGLLAAGILACWKQPLSSPRTPRNEDGFLSASSSPDRSAASSNVVPSAGCKFGLPRLHSNSSTCCTAGQSTWDSNPTLWLCEHCPPPRASACFSNRIREIRCSTTRWIPNPVRRAQ
jgi:hypothetical protein